MRHDEACFPPPGRLGKAQEQLGTENPKDDDDIELEVDSNVLNTACNVSPVMRISRRLVQAGLFRRKKIVVLTFSSTDDNTPIRIGLTSLLCIFVVWVAEASHSNLVVSYTSRLLLCNLSRDQLL